MEPRSAGRIRSKHAQSFSSLNTTKSFAGQRDPKAPRENPNEVVSLSEFLESSRIKSHKGSGISTSSFKRQDSFKGRYKTRSVPLASLITSSTAQIHYGDTVKQHSTSKSNHKVVLPLVADEELPTPKESKRLGMWHKPSIDFQETSNDLEVPNFSSKSPKLKTYKLSPQPSFTEPIHSNIDSPVLGSMHSGLEARVPPEPAQYQNWSPGPQEASKYLRSATLPPDMARVDRSKKTKSVPNLKIVLDRSPFVRPSVQSSSMAFEKRKTLDYSSMRATSPSPTPISASSIESPVSQRSSMCSLINMHHQIVDADQLEIDREKKQKFDALLALSTTIVKDNDAKILGRIISEELARSPRLELALGDNQSIVSSTDNALSPPLSPATSPSLFTRSPTLATITHAESFQKVKAKVTRLSQIARPQKMISSLDELEDSSGSIKTTPASTYSSPGRVLPSPSCSGSMKSSKRHTTHGSVKRLSNLLEFEKLFPTPPERKGDGLFGTESYSAPELGRQLLRSPRSPLALQSINVTTTTVLAADPPEKRRFRFRSFSLSTLSPFLKSSFPKGSRVSSSSKLMESDRPMTMEYSRPRFDATICRPRNPSIRQKRY